MATLIPNDYSKYELSDEEAVYGAVLTETQAQVIQNEIALIAEEILALEYDVNNPTDFIQRESFKKGQLQILKYRLDCSITAIEELEYKATNPQTPQ
jgi:hypothetical protein